MSVNTIPFRLFEPFEKNMSRSLKFDLNALADFEEKTGMGFSQLMSTKAVFAATRAMLWAGLKHEDRMLTIDGVGDLIAQVLASGTSIQEVMVIAMSAATDQGAFGKPDEKEAGKLRLVAKNMADDRENKKTATAAPTASTSAPNTDLPDILVSAEHGSAG
jgi:hypothetical protein